MALPATPASRATAWRLHGRAVSMLLALLVLFPAAAATATMPAIEGNWVLDEDASTDPEDAFDDKLRRDAYPVPWQEPGPGEARTSRDQSQSEYWDTVRQGKERHSLKNLQRLGAAYPLVMAQRIDIKAEGDGYEIIYDEALPRGLRVNPAGRVFSASGDELTHDSIGYTLMYWDGDVLALETDLPEGGKVLERFRAYDSPRQLEYTLRVEMRILEEPVEFKRVLVPPGQD